MHGEVVEPSVQVDGQGGAWQSQVIQVIHSPLPAPLPARVLLPFKNPSSTHRNEDEQVNWPGERLFEELAQVPSSNRPRRNQGRAPDLAKVRAEMDELMVT